MTIDLSEVQHPTTLEALTYAQDYYANYFSPLYPPFTFHKYDFNEAVLVIASWGYYDLFIVHSRIKATVLFALVADWTDEAAMRGWVFWRDPATGDWYTECDSTETDLHHWQEVHRFLKEENPNMSDILDLLTEIRDYLAAVDGHVNVDLSTRAVEAGGNLAAIAAALNITLQDYQDWHEGWLDDINSNLSGIANAFPANNRVIAYSDRFVFNLDETSTGQPWTFVLTDPVPAGEIWMLQVANVTHNDPTARDTSMQAYDGTNQVLLHHDLALEEWVNLIWTGHIALKQGDKIRAACNNLANTKKLYLRAWGHKMKV